MPKTKNLHQRIISSALIFSMLQMLFYPISFTSAQEIIQNQNTIRADDQRSLTEIENGKQKVNEENLAFNFIGEATAEENKVSKDFLFGASQENLIASQKLEDSKFITGRLPLNSKSKNQPPQSTELELDSSTRNYVNTNQDYFNDLINRSASLKVKDKAEALRLGWKEINIETPQSIQSLVKKVPRELDGILDQPDKEIIKNKESKESRQSKSLPLLALQPEYLIFIAKENGDNPNVQTLKLTNRGEGSLSYSLSEDSSWLTLSSTSGTLTTDTNVITISVDIAGLTSASSSYTADIVVNNITNPEDTRLVKVKLVINENYSYNGSFSYDANFNLRRKIDANGNIVDFEYNNLNQLTKIIYPDMSGVSFEYDENGNRTSLTDEHGTTTYVYDNFDRLYAIYYPGINPIVYEYDKADRITKIIYPDQQEISYTYDTDDRLLTVTDNTGTTAYTYNPTTGNLDSVTLPNSLSTTYTYDPDSRLIDVVNRGPSGNLISAYHYTLDANGMRTRVIEEKPSGSKTTSYTYDNLNRLKTVTYPDGRLVTYTYDELGNRLAMADSVNGLTTYVYDNDNRLIELNGPDGKEVFLYDNNGNLVKRANTNIQTRGLLSRKIDVIIT